MKRAHLCLLGMALLVPQTGLAQGVAVTVGEAPVIPGLNTLPPVALSQSLHWVNAKSQNKQSLVEGAIKLFTKGEKLFWGKGKINSAIKKLEEGRQLLPPRVTRPQRPQVLKGLWLLAQLYLHKKRAADGERAILDALRIDAMLTLDKNTASPDLLALYRALQEAFVRRGAYLRVNSTATGACLAMVDGVVEGRMGVRLGPFEAGNYEISLECDGRRSPTYSIQITAGTRDLVIDASELGLSLTAAGIKSEDLRSTKQLSRVLFKRTPAKWVVFIAAAPQGKVDLKLHLRKGANPRIGADIEPSAVGLWIRNHAEPETPRSSVGGRWLQITTIVVGAGLVVGGAVVHGQALEVLDETNTGTVDRRDDMESLETTYGTLYIVGAIVTAVGVGWLTYGLLGTDDTALIPGPGSLHLVHRF